MKDYYYLLGIRKDATKEEISSAYRKLSKKFHPDVEDNAEDEYFVQRAKDINEAYGVLKDEGKRRAYDRQLDAQRQGAHRAEEQAYRSRTYGHKSHFSSYEYSQNNYQEEQKQDYTQTQYANTGRGATVIDYSPVRKKAIKNILKLLGLSVLSKLVTDILITFAHPAYVMMPKANIELAAPYLVLPILFCGWMVILYIKNYGNDPNKISVTIKREESLLEVLLMMAIKVIIAFSIGFIALQLYLILNILVLINPAFIWKYRHLRSII